MQHKPSPARTDTRMLQDATSTATGVRWLAEAPDEYTAAVELAKQVGFDLGDG